MGFSSIQSNLPTFNTAVPETGVNSRSKKNSDTRPSVQNRLQATAVTESYSSKSMQIEYTSKDGDTVSLSMQSVEYSKSMLEIAAEGDSEKMDDLIAYIKDSYTQMKKDMVNQFVKSLGGKVNETDQASSVKKFEVPEEWNAENTSQRIVDFALSFYGAVDKQGNDFFEAIKGAIIDGFKQARDILGNLPKEANALIDDTYSKVMEKLDAWAKNQEITPTTKPASTEKTLAA